MTKKKLLETTAALPEPTLTEKLMTSVAPIILVGGDKGGVGKSMITRALIDWMIEAGFSPVIVDADSRNADVMRAFKERADGFLIDLRLKEGWVEFGNLVGRTAPERPMVINTPAGIGQMMNAKGDLLKRYRRPVVLIWPINREIDALWLLKQAIENFGQHLADVIVLKNLFFGEPKKFSLWERSEIRVTVEKLGGVLDHFPDLIDLVTVEMNNEMLSPLAALKHEKFEFGERIELEDWLDQVRALFDRLRPKMGL